MTVMAVEDGKLEGYQGIFKKTPFIAIASLTPTAVIASQPPSTALRELASFTVHVEQAQHITTKAFYVHSPNFSS